MSSSYEIKIDIGKLLHYSEVLRPQIKTETLLVLIRSFSVYVKKLYISEFTNAIYSRRYQGEWEPVEDEGYLKYIGTEPSVHILDLMIDALEIREIKNNVIIRFNPRYKYPGSRLTLVKVLKAIDNGTSKFNARPILKSIVRSIERDLVVLWKRHLKMGGVA